MRFFKKNKQPEQQQQQKLQRVIALDEPTTGLDPITKRIVWRMIEKAKAGKTIILTTHSMQEANALSDKIGIVSAGQMRAIGTKEHLKRRFGLGNKLQVIHQLENSAKFDNICVQAAPYVRLVSREDVPHLQRVKSLYIVPSQHPIQFLYEACIQAKENGLIDQFEIDFTNLEEVFLNVTNLVEPNADNELQ